MREMKAEVGNVDTRLKINGMGRAVVACCLQSENVLQRVVDEFYCVCRRRKPNVDAGKSKVIVFEGRE